MSVHQKTPLHEWKGNPQRRYLQHIYTTRELYPHYLKNSYPTVIKKEPIDKNMGKRLEKTTHKNRYTNTNNNMKGYSGSLSSRKYKLHIQYICTQMTQIKNAENVKYWQRDGVVGTLTHCPCECKCFQPLQKTGFSY